MLANGGSTVTVSVSGGSQTIAVPVALFDNVSVSAASGASLTVSGAVGDGGAGKSLTISGAGTLILAGSNTYSGGTTLSAGQLNLNNASALGTGTLTISGGTIGNTSGAALTLSTNNAQNWNGNFTFAGANDLNLGAGAVTLNASRTVTVASGNLTVGGVISGSGCSLTKAGTGTLTLGGACFYSGVTSIQAGTLAFGVGVGTTMPVAHFAFDGPLGPIADGAVIPDSSSNHNNGTLSTGRPGTSYVPGKFGNAINFNDGSNPYVQIPYSSAYNLSTYTVSDWINVPAGGGGGIFQTLYWGGSSGEGVSQYYCQSSGQLDTDLLHQQRLGKPELHWVQV